jgi:RND family efflux transporter MFP subunit
MRWPLALALGATLAACKPAEPVQKAAAPRPVRTITVQPPGSPSLELFPGRIEAKEALALGFRINGRLVERLANVGDHVRPGQILARLDKTIELNEARAARAQLHAAESRLRQTEAQFERTSHLLQRGIASAAEYEQAEHALKGARAAFDATAARLAIAEDHVHFTVLKADAAGVITAVNAEPGEFLAAGRAVFQVARRDGRDAVIDVPALALPLMDIGSPARIIMAGAGSSQLEGRIREIDPEADAVTRLFRVRIGIIDPPPTVRIGIPIDVAITAIETTGIMVPMTAVVRDGSKDSVFVVNPEQSSVARRAIVRGMEHADTVVISAGLVPGEIVVTAGTATLQDGQKVRLVGGAQ